ncbi:MAG: NAD(P)H-hydrate epimerase [Coriobacteriia bacterium]|nr:NAD(P)H-hydrate epimerase [Coriobacteriia bacterium]
MLPIVTNGLMRESDAFTIENFVNEVELMDRAGTAVYEAMGHRGFRQGKIAVVCGPGNNGGDGYRLAILLAKHDYVIDCFYTKDPSSFSSVHFFSTLNSTPLDNLSVHLATEDLDLSGYDTVVDCLLGTGFEGEPHGLVASCIKAINAAKDSGVKVVSVDINSGMNGNTGDGELVVNSDLTVTIGAPKIGMALPQASAHMTDTITADIGIKFAGTPFQLVSKEEMDAVVESTGAYAVEAETGSFSYMYLIALANEARENEMSFVFEADGGRAQAMTGNLFIQQPTWISNDVIALADNIA